MNQKQFIQSGNYLIDEVKRRAEKGSPYFFSDNTMRFFKSRVSELCWQTGDIKKYQTNDIYFITSEKRDNYKRLFTVRKSDKSGDHKTIGEFQQYGSLNEARKAIKETIHN